MMGHGSQSGTPETPLGGCSGQIAGQYGWISFVLLQLCSPEMGMGARLYEGEGEVWLVGIIGGEYS